ncbi:MAG: glycosyl hydrolase family 95 catalytic domain-containing protein [Armatimonadota bacterium]
MARTYDWYFPLPRTHTGMLQGNGTMGAMIWGEGSTLRVTIGRADFWDHRGGIHWSERVNFNKIRAALESGSDAELNDLFGAHPEPGQPAWPSVLPIGRIEIDFGDGARLTKGTLDLEDGTATVEVERDGDTHEVRLALDMDAPLLGIEFPKGLAPAEIRRVTSWEYVGEYLASISFEKPEMLDAPELSGWVQRLPADPGLCLGYRMDGRQLLLTAAIGDDPRAAALQVLDGAEGFKGIRERNRAWWKAYWKTVPEVDVPNERLQFLHDYGMYKFAGLTNPDGVPATLQGPWIEEYQMPPWSSDYHFNINVQMCYWPAYHGNRLSHLRPLFEMVASWKDVLQHNAKVFVGVDDGLMLPHSVDDRCTTIGGFWAGSLDHGCTAWVAQMMYRYYRYTMDRAFLAEVAYPFMAGAMRVFEEMLEEDGDRLSLPVSVSPEYRSVKTGSWWGKNASFQLACLHRLCEDLLEASDALGIPPKPRWQEIQAKTPRACLIDASDGEQIAMWEGVDLEESHRHHSHLAGITPFDVFELDAPEMQPIIQNSLTRWILRGPGLWSGWCVPWAAMIHLRFDKGDAAELLLENFQHVFTNVGHGTLHDADMDGWTLMGRSYLRKDPARGELMQMDGGMSSTAAIQEMLLHTRRGVNHLFAGLPRRWRKASFEHMRTDGAFLVSANYRAGEVTRVEVESPAGGVFRLANPWDGPAKVQREGKEETIDGKVLEIATEPGKTIVIKRG